MGQAVVMAITLPLPVRVAAGILATGIDTVRSLPTEIPAIPVALVGNALKLSMKVQQEIASLATRGDELLGGVIGAPQENPSWARFDDDPPPAPRPTVVRTPAGRSAAPAAEPALTTPEASAMPPGATTAMEAALEVPSAVVELALVAVDDEPDAEPPAGGGSDESLLAEQIAEEVLAQEVAAEIVAEEVLAEEVAAEILAEEVADEIATEIATEIAAIELVQEAEEAAAELLAVALADETVEELAEELLTESIADEPAEGATPSDDGDSAGPAALPGYDRMTLAQVRSHLRELSAEEVTSLLDYERSGDNRAPFLTLLSNRLVTLDAQQP
jgi:hypothetical protein